MNHWKIQKNIARVLAYLLIAVCLYQAYIILDGYYDRNKDKSNFNFWDLKEEINWNRYNEEAPPLLKMVSAQFDTFRNYCILLFVMTAYFAFCKYKEDPQKAKDGMKNSWSGKLLKKMQDEKIIEKLED